MAGLGFATVDVPLVGNVLGLGVGLLSGGLSRSTSTSPGEPGVCSAVDGSGGLEGIGEGSVVDGSGTLDGTGEGSVVEGSGRLDGKGEGSVVEGSGALEGTGEG